MKPVVTLYRTANLGDSIQSIALVRLLGECYGVHRDDLPRTDMRGYTYVCNGWHRNYSEVPRIAGIKTHFVGVHTNLEEHHIKWLAQSGLIGARDPFTHALLDQSGIESQMVGCATLTLPFYDGSRSGLVRVDAAPSNFTHCANGYQKTSRGQWARALQMLSKYANAEEVITTRLHVALPCLALGTPVQLIRRAKVFQPERLSLWESLGLPFDVTVRPERSAVKAWADRYVSFLLHKVPGLRARASEYTYPREILRPIATGTGTI